jgi:ABC-2 type transport system ATP-binding protein
MESEFAIDIRHLTHRYGVEPAVNDISFQVRLRSIHGFVGPNGAGKTTTLKILATLIRPQSGTVLLFGKDIVREFKEVRQKIGFMPDHFSTYRQMTVFEYLDFFGAAYGLSSGARDTTITNVLTLTDMEGRRDSFISTLSRGMQQRVSLARVLVHDPALLLLDEPASGLDPRARIELMDILHELRRLGKTIFISSHILSELATLCDEVTVLDRGTVKYSGAMRGLVAGTHGNLVNYMLTFAAEHPEAAAALAKLPGVQRVSPPLPNEPRYTLTFESATTTVNTILQTALAHGAQIVSCQEELKHLNDAFMDLTEPGVRS